MPNRWPISSGNWSNAAIWSGSLIPTASDDVFSNTFTVNVDQNITVNSLNNTATTGVTAGGAFNFNTPSITANISSSIGLNLGTNLPIFTVTATSGSVTISSPLVSWTVGNLSSLYLTNAGNCDLTITAIQFSGFRSDSSGANNGRCIEKTGTGTLTLNGNVLGQGGFRNNSNHGVSISGGNLIVNGSVIGGFTSSTGGANYGINMTAGRELTINGDVVGGVGHTSNAVVHRGSRVTVVGNVSNISTTPPGVATVAIDTTAPMFITGNITGGIGGYTTIVTTDSLTVNGNVTATAGLGISTTGPIVIINGTITGGSIAAISSTSATSVNVSGSIVSSATANAVSLTNASAVVNLAGNMVNTSGKTAIYCQNLRLSNTDTTTAQFFTIGSQDRTLYSSDTFPNLPSASEVRFGTTYGPGSGNTGTLRMASSQDVRSGVLTDNTTGSAILSIESLSNEVQTSSDPFAQRLRDIPTVDIIGNLLTAFKK